MTAPTLRGEPWPEFDRWQAAFAAAGAFPARWDGLHAAPPAHAPAALEYRLRKQILMAEWLEMLDRRSAERGRYARRGLRVRAVRQDADRPCPACDPLDARELGPGLDAMPPFHPGCRCVLVAAPAEPAGRRATSSDRLRSRVG